MTPELTPQEIDEIDREAEIEYPDILIEERGSVELWEMYEFNDMQEYKREAYAAALRSERLKHKAEIQAYKDVIALKDEYIQLLTDELSDMAGMAYVHGWRSTRVEKGQELRDKISQFKL